VKKVVKTSSKPDAEKKKKKPIREILENEDIVEVDETR